MRFRNIAGNAFYRYNVVDEDHSNTLAAYRAMGSPQYPTEAQVRKINDRTALPAPEEHRLSGGAMTLVLKPNALALVEVDGNR